MWAFSSRLGLGGIVQIEQPYMFVIRYLYDGAYDNSKGVPYE